LTQHEAVVTQAKAARGKPLPRFVKAILTMLALVIVLVPVGLAIWIGTGARGAIPLIATLIDGQKIGRFGQLKLEGVTETSDGAKILSASLSDAKGAWIVVKGVDFAWKPRALLARRIEISRINAVQTLVMRQPELGPRGKPRRLPVDVRIASFATNLRLAAGFVGRAPALSHQAKGQIALNRDSSFDLKVATRSLMGPYDQLNAELSRSRNAPLRIQINANGGPTGIINTLLGAPDAPNTKLDLVIIGDTKTGETIGRLTSGDQTYGDLRANWMAQNGRLDGFLAPHPQSWLGQNLARLGGRIDVDAQAGDVSSGRRQVLATVTAPALLARFTGPIDFQNIAVAAGSALTLERGNLALLSNQKIAGQKIAGLLAGTFNVEGQRRDGMLIGSLKGQVNLTGLNGFGLALNRVTTPLEISATASRLKIGADLEGQMARANDPRLATFGTNPKLALQIEQDRRTGIWFLNKAQLTGRGLQANVTGRMSGQGRELKGRADLADVAALVPNIAGPAQVAIDLRQSTGAPWQGKATLRAQNLKSKSQIVTDLIGRQLTGEITPTVRSTGDSFEWQVKTSNASARGTLALSDKVPLRGAWALKSPLALSRVSVSGVARGGTSGDLAFGPAGFAVGSQNARIAIGGWILDNAKFLAVGGTNGRPITASVSGIAPLGPAQVSGVIATSAGVISFTDVQAKHAGLQAIGTGRSAGSNFDGLFDLKIEPGAVLISGSSSGRLGVAVRNGQVGLAADLALKQAAFANVPVQVPVGRVRATGLLGALSLAFEGDVRAGNQQGRLNLTGLADLDGRETSLILNGGGDIGGRRIVISQPLRAVPLGTKARLTGQALWGDYRLGLDGQVRGGGLDVKYVELLGPSLSARLAGRLGGGDFALRGNARASNLSTLNARLSGSADGNLSIAGRGGDNWTAQVIGGANGFSLGNKDADALLGARPRFELAARAAAGRDISGSWKLTGKQLSGEGLVSLPKQGRLSNANGNWRIEGPVKLGGVDISGRVNGTILLQDAALAIAATSPNLAFAGQSWTDLRVIANIPDIFTMREIPIDAVANGSLGPLKLNTKFQQGPSPSLQPLVVSYGGIEGRGNIMLGTGGPSGTLTLQGSLGAIMTSGTAQGTVAFSQSNLGTQINARLGLSDARFERAGITQLTGTIAANGPLKDLVATVDTRFDLRGEAASARLNGRFTQTGDVNRFVVNGGGLYQGAAWRLAEPLLVASQNKTNRAAGRLVWRDADLDFVSVMERGGLNLTATLKDAPASLFATGQTRLDGRLSGNVTLRGQGQNVSGEGRLVATGLKPRAAQASEAIDGNISAQLRGGALTLRGSANNPRGLRATGDARLPVITSLSPFRLEVVRTGALNGQFEIVGPVEAIAKLALSRNSTASGTLTARGQLSGTIASPQVQGRAQLENAALTDASLGVRVTNANAVVNFLGPVADIETLTASDGRGGKLQLGGRIAFGRAATWRLNGQMDKFQLIGSNEALIVATGPWSLAANGGQAILGGNLVLDNARIGIPASTNRADTLRVREINRPADLAPLAAQSETLAASQRTSNSDLGLDLRLTSAGNARVVSRGFDGYFDLGLTVKGSLRAPQVDGRADLVRGRFDLAGRSFDMTKGSVAFLTPLTASRIEFIAQRETADITALAKIKGTLGRPVFSLESTQPSPQDEILSRILFGRNVAALTLPQAAQLALGVSSLATGNQLDPTARLGQALGLERFSLGTQSGGFDGFTAGLRLVRDVYVEVTTGGEDGTVTMLEWRPRRRVQVQVTTSQKRESTVSVRLRSKD
jgi:translocation and assembly module TamB